MKYTIYLLLLISFFTSCNSDDVADIPDERIGQLFEQLSPEQTGVQFINSVKDQEEFNVLTYRNYYNGGGVAIGDVNNDGLGDLFFTANIGDNKLFLNKGGLQFEDITDRAGVAGKMAWSTGATVADVNADGLLDIYVCNSGDVKGDAKTNELYINNGDLTFTESATQYGLDNEGFSTHASFFDYDLDGDLDVYLLNNSFKDPKRINFRGVRDKVDKIGGDKLMRNDGNKFVDVTEEAGMYSSEIGFGLGVSVSDMNDDGYPDMYISNDFWERDYLYINQRNGTFSEELVDRVSFTSTSSMGSDIADIDNNGTVDLFSTDMLPGSSAKVKRTTMFGEFNLENKKYRSDYHYQYIQNGLQVNNGKAQFTEIANFSGVAATDWSWGALMFDFNNDGLKDIFVSNGVYVDITDMDFANFLNDKEEVRKIVEERGSFDLMDFLKYLPSKAIPNYAFVNEGDLRFNNRASEIGLGLPTFSNGSAYADLDNDGDHDLVINNVNMPSMVYENKTQGANYLKINLNGSSGNPFAIGAKVRLYAGDLTLLEENYQSRGFQSAVEPSFTVGLGKQNNVDSLVVEWPGGKISRLYNQNVNKSITISEGEAHMGGANQYANSNAIFRKADTGLLELEHTEDEYNDFDFNILALRMMSSEGPEVLVGDLTGDGLDDAVMLSTSDSEIQVMKQGASGAFLKIPQIAFKADKVYEDTAGELIDLDGDGDLDIVVGSGGNDSRKSFQASIVRTYLNDGAGTFKRTLDILPYAIGNLSVVESIELDLNGTQGLFLGGLCVPGVYGLTPRNYLFMGYNGKWIDVTDQAIGQTGMVTDAMAGDIDNDGDEDLVVVGEWMPIMIFENNQQKLSLKHTIENSEGLWQSVMVEDVNDDGYADILAGNWGLNSKLQASVDQPLEIYVNDFDGNKSIEGIMTWYGPEDDRPYVFHSKSDLTSRLPFLKKQILKNEDFANSTLDQIIEPQSLAKAQHKKVVTLASKLWMGSKNGTFTSQSLPKEVQYAPMMDAVAVDADGDGVLDVLFGGNFYDLKPEIGRQDGYRGGYLKGLSNGQFSYISALDSGIQLNGQVRSINAIEINEKKHFIYAYNDRQADVFTGNK